jgi:thiol-disulfide isomerase/thioredoxin
MRKEKAMLSSRTLAVTIAVGLLTGATPAAEEPTTAATTAPAAQGVPDELIRKIDARFQMPQDTPPARRRALIIKRMEGVLELGAQAEKKYPEAGNLHLVRNRMLSAADVLARVRQDPYDRRRVRAIAGRILASKGPAEAKLQADALVTSDKLVTMVGKERDQELLGLVRRYEKTEVASMATMYGAMLADRTGATKVRARLLDDLESKYMEAPFVRAFLRRMGRRPDVGKPFEAELTTVDGRKLTLPGDLKGKVVVIDFWATWCGPCIDELPHMKRLYAKYGSKGVEIVGVSLDRPNGLKDLKKFVKENNMGWVHTYSGKYWDDPTIRKYGIDGIPSIWVVGRDGKVVSDDARANLEETIEKALKAPAEKKG